MYHLFLQIITGNQYDDTVTFLQVNGNMIFISLSPQSSYTINSKNTVIGYKKGSNFFSKYTFIHAKHIFQMASNSIEYSPTDGQKNLQIKYGSEKYTIFMYKMVRKCGQKRDFTKLRSAPKT